MPVRCEGHERKVHAIQHQLDRHKNRDDVALDQEPEHTTDEQNSAQQQIIGKRNHHPSFRRPLGTARGRLASTTAPMIAIRISTDVTSNGSRKSWNRSRAISLGSPFNAPMGTACVLDRLRSVQATSPPPISTPGIPSRIANRLPLVRSSA